MKISNPAIDSFRMYIPITKVEFTPEGEKQLLEKKVITSEAQMKKQMKELINELKNGMKSVEEIEEELEDFNFGLDEEEFKRVAYEVAGLKSKGITIRLLVLEHYHFQEGTNTYLVLLINSKILKEKYLLGITKETIKDIWLELLSLELFYVEFEDFLNGTLVDVDIKADIKDLSPKDFKVCIKELNRISSSGELYLPKRGQKIKNLGLEYGYRKKQHNVRSKPYVKLYHKTVELRYQSRIFTDNFLKDIDIKNLARIEGTIKNKKHLRSLGIKENTLGNLLEKLTEEKILEINWNFLNKHLKMERSIAMVDTKKLNISGKDIEIFDKVRSHMLLEGYSLETIKRRTQSLYNSIGASRPTIRAALKRAEKYYFYILANDKEVEGKKPFLEFMEILGGNLNEKK